MPEETTISVRVSQISAMSGLLASRRGYSAKIGEQMAAEWEKTAGAEGQAILKAYKSK